MPDKLIKPSDLRAEAQRLIAAGKMPSLEAVMTAVGKAREKYLPEIAEARKSEK